jgi:hypothetical protein
VGFGHRCGYKDIGFKDIFHDIRLAQRCPFGDRSLLVEFFLVKGMDDVVAKGAACISGALDALFGWLKDSVQGRC